MERQGEVSRERPTPRLPHRPHFAFLPLFASLGFAQSKPAGVTYAKVENRLQGELHRLPPRRDSLGRRKPQLIRESDQRPVQRQTARDVQEPGQERARPVPSRERRHEDAPGGKIAGLRPPRDDRSLDHFRSEAVDLGDLGRHRLGFRDPSENDLGKGVLRPHLKRTAVVEPGDRLPQS